MEKELIELPDIYRLERVCRKLKSLEDIYYHMDSDEYERMKTYVYSRFGISLPLNDPTKQQP